MAILFQGLILLLAGMGTVYLFLTLLIGIIDRSAQIAPKFRHALPGGAPKHKARPAHAHPHPR